MESPFHRKSDPPVRIDIPAVPGLVPSEEARNLILSGAAPSGILTDELVFKKETSLVRLPAGIRVGKLFIEDCPNLVSLPERLAAEHAVLRRCDSLSSIPSSIWAGSLTIQGCRKLAHLPEGLELGEVAILDCPRLTSLPGRFSFRTLRMPGSRLSVLPVRCARASALDLSDSHHLMHIPSLNLREIVLRNCTALRYLPDEIEADVLNISGCTSLRWQDFALIEVKTLDLSNCTQIDHLPDWLTVGYAIDVANSGLKGLPPWLKHCAVLWRVNFPLAMLNRSECFRFVAHPPGGITSSGYPHGWEGATRRLHGSPGLMNQRTSIPSQRPKDEFHWVIAPPPGPLRSGTLFFL